MKRFTEEGIKTESIKALLYWMRQYEVECREDYRNGDAYMKEIGRIEEEIIRRIKAGQKTIYEVRISFLRGEHLEDYEKRGYVASYECYRERFTARKEAEADLRESLENCHREGWPILSSGIEEVEG